MSFLIITLLVILFIAYIIYELYGSHIKSRVRATLPLIRIAAVGVATIIIIYLYFTDKSMFLSIMETVAPPSVSNAMKMFSNIDASNSDILKSDIQNGGGDSSNGTKFKRNVSTSKKKRVAASQKWHCSICKEILDETYEVDHIIALKDGGSNEIDNLRALCRPCHAKKTAEES